jgi:hypothetical protein
MQRAFVSFVVAITALAAPAHAQPSHITLAADPTPIVAARINDRAVRLEVDLRLPDALVLSVASAERIGVRRVPFVAVGVGVDGGAVLRGRLARPRLVFDGGDSRAFAGIFPVPVTARADGVIGPGALPYDVITITLGAEQQGARDIVFTLDDADKWTGQAQVGGEPLRVNFDVARPTSVLNRTASRLFDASGAITPAGDLVESHVIIGLTTLMQPVTTDLTVEGLRLGTTHARTNSPLLGADDPDMLVVEAEAENARPAEITLGREALAVCSSITVTRATRRMVLRCAG